MKDILKSFRTPSFLPLLAIFALIQTEGNAQKIFSQSAIFSNSVEFCSETKTRDPEGTFLPPLPGIRNDVFYLRLALQLDPAVSYLKGKTVIYFRAKTKGDTLAFYLHDSLAVTSVKFHNKNLLPLRPGGHVLVMPLGSTLWAGERDSIIIAYEGIPGTLAGQRGLFTVLHNGKPYLWTLSEPYGAPTWWPAKLNLDDKIDSLQIAIAHPPAYRSAANGMLIKETYTDTLAVTVWKHRYPIVPYLISVAVGEYAIYEENKKP